MATGLVGPFTLLFSRFLGCKNIWPKVLYLLHASARQWHTICTLSSFLSPHSRQSCCCVSPSLNIWAERVVWPANYPTATVSFCLPIAWSSFVLLGRGTYIRFLDWWQPSRVFHLFKCFSLKWLQMTSLPTENGIPTVLSDGTPLVLYLANLSAYSFPCVPWFLGIHIKVTLLDSLSFSSACVLFHTRADLVVVLQMLLLLPYCQSRYIFFFFLPS